MLNFIRESNKIEGILREPTDGEIEAMEDFMALPELSVKALEDFVLAYQPNALLRYRASVPSVRVGKHVPIASGPRVLALLDSILYLANTGSVTPYNIHRRYETLHPLTDCNGRSGRALWAWCMFQRVGPFEMDTVFQRGFLHTWYYQSLSEFRVSEAPVDESFWVHKKRGSKYSIIGYATVQTGTEIKDNAKAVIYKDTENNYYVREPKEFFDGRFEEIKT